MNNQNYTTKKDTVRYPFSFRSFSSLGARKTVTDIAEWPARIVGIRFFSMKDSIIVQLTYYSQRRCSSQPSWHVQLFEVFGK